MEYLESKFFLLAITFGFFFLSKQLQKKTGLIILNPILIAIALLICFLKLTNVSYEKYYDAGSFPLLSRYNSCMEKSNPRKRRISFSCT